MGEIKVLLFDVDGVLCESRQKAKPEMLKALTKLSKKYYLALVTGGTIDLIRHSVTNYLSKEVSEMCILFPQSASQLWWYNQDGRAELVHSEKLTDVDTQKIRGTLKFLMDKYHIPKIGKEDIAYPQIDERGAQITFSPIGANAPLELKKAYDPDQSKRKEWVRFLSYLLPDYQITVGGTTSIDVTKKGIDKSLAVKFLEYMGFKKKEMVAFADAFFEGGNDEPIKLTGIKCTPVKNPEQTLRKLEKYL